MEKKDFNIVQVNFKDLLENYNIMDYISEIYKISIVKLLFFKQNKDFLNI